jgi:CRISPR system Cascade subunit CasC
VTCFIQLHALTPYPPSNPNRDDLGKPKTAIYGGATRMRISSQALKRAIRTSEIFGSKLDGHIGQRTQRIGDIVRDHLIETKKASPEQAEEVAKTIAGVFGALDDNARIKQLAFVSPDERKTALTLAEKLLAGEKLPEGKDLAKLALRRADGAADIAMFGRMLADNPDFNREAAVQVAHAITTNKIAIEDDYYTAVDDLKKPEEDAGAGFVGEAAFASGVFYLYVCIDRDLLAENLAGDTELADRAIEAFIEALTTATPSGKKAGFAHQTYAGYLLAEKGSQQPRSLAGAFLKPVAGDNLLESSIVALERHCKAMDDAYGARANGREKMNVEKGEGTLAKIIAFATAKEC